MKKTTLDSLVRKILRKTESQCFTCGRHKNAAILEVGHFVPRRYLATRWDLRNCHLQCLECNREKAGNIPAYKEKLGEDLSQELWRFARAQQKTDIYLVYDILANILKRLA